MKIARVFPSKTSHSPCDQDCYFDTPDLFTPEYNEIHISVTFTWDIKKAYFLAEAWRVKGKVKIGGVAIDGESDQPFQAGMYLKKGITITSRGCNNNCKFCQVRHPLIEFDNFPKGNIIQDNNLLQCSDKHIDLVFDMLKNQKQIIFSGGLDKYRIKSKMAEKLRGLKIKTLWLACDHSSEINVLRNTALMLYKAGFTRNHIYCYVLIGDNFEENENRLKEVYRAGAMPFAQLYKNKENNIIYSKEFKQLARQWSRPAIYKNIMKKVNYWIGLKYACFGITTENDIVIKSAPIGKWMIGKSISEIKKWILNKKGEIIKIV